MARIFHKYICFNCVKLCKRTTESTKNKNIYILQILEFYNNGLQSRASKNHVLSIFMPKKYVKFQMQLERIKVNQHITDY